jgi:FkbM family methyltransferase
MEAHMWDVWKQRIQLLGSMRELFDAYEDGVHISSENWEDMKSALGVFELPGENVMNELIDRICGGTVERDDFPVLKEYFTRFFDTRMSAAANSSMISEDHRSGKYGCDREFSGYVDMIRNTSLQDISAGIFEKLKAVSVDDPVHYKLLTEHSRGWFHEGLQLDGIGGADNSLITYRAATLKRYIDKIEWVYENLSDAVSRRSLNAIINCWLTWNYSDWTNIATYSNDVVDTSIYPFYENEVFVDCGSFTGDTVMQYINTVNNNFARVYTYDISGASIKEIKKVLAPYSNIIIRHAGTGDTNTEMSLIGVDNAFHGNKLLNIETDTAVEKVEVVRLDDDIKEPISFLKIDCEGMDKETLIGAQGQIRRYHPKLHIDTYHKLADLVNVPLLIREIDPSYSLYLRIPRNLEVEPRFPAMAYLAV